MSHSKSDKPINPNDPEVMKATVFSHIDETINALYKVADFASVPGKSDLQNVERAADLYLTLYDVAVLKRIKNALDTSPALPIACVDDSPTMKQRFAQAIASARSELEQLPATFETKAQEQTTNPELQKVYIGRISFFSKLTRNFLRRLDTMLTSWNLSEVGTGSDDGSALIKRIAWAETALPKYHKFLIRLQEYDAAIQYLMKSIGEQFVENKHYAVRRRDRVFQLPKGTDTYEDCTEIFEKAIKTDTTKAISGEVHYDCIWSLTSGRGDVEFMRVKYVDFDDFTYFDLFYPVPYREHVDGYYYQKLTSTCVVKMAQFNIPLEIGSELIKLKDQREIGPITSRRLGTSVEWQMQTVNGTIALGKGG